MTKFCLLFAAYFSFLQAPSSWEFVKKSGKNLVFKNGISYNTRLYDLKFISVLGKSPKPYFLVTGRSCNNCGENIQVYILGIDDIKKPFDSIGTYIYPGILRDYENNKVVSMSEMIYGKCLKDSKNDYVIWLQSDKNDTGKLIKSIYIVEITTSGILEKKIMESDLQYKKILSSLNKKSKELKGLELTTEP